MSYEEGTMPNVRGSSTDGLDEGGGERPPTGRKDPMRPPTGRKYPMRPIDRKYPMRPYGVVGDPRQDWPPPQPDKYPMRPYDARKYPMRPYDEPGTLDPDEWSADVSQLFCCSSAVVRLGARLVYDGDAIPAADVPLTWPGPTYQPPGLVKPVDNPVAPVQVLRPASHELAVTVPLSNQLANDLASRPDVAWAMKEDIANALALAADGGFLNGAGPPGLTGVAAVATRTGPAGLDPLAKARKMVAQLRGVAPEQPRDRWCRFGARGGCSTRAHSVPSSRSRPPRASEPATADVGHDRSTTPTCCGTTGTTAVSCWAIRSASPRGPA